MTNLQLITTPFAENGTKNIIPEGGAAEPQLATMQAGFPEITQRPISDGGIPPERADFNGILNLYGQHLVHLNKGLPYGFDQDFANSIGGYPLNARIMLSNGDVVQNTQEGNTNNPNSNMGGWNSSEVSKDVTVPTYKTAADGVNPVTGVAGGAYFNVRSENDDTVAIEYQNVGGSAVATGKSYLSAIGVQLQKKDASTIQVGDSTLDVFALEVKKATDFYVTPQMYVDSDIDITDGVVDAYPYIKAALDSGYPVVLPFPRVAYRVTQNIVFQGHKVDGAGCAAEAYGTGIQTPVLILFDGVTGDAVKNTGKLSEINNIHFKQKDWSTELNGCFLERYAYFTNCLFTHFNGFGWYGFVDAANQSKNPFHTVFTRCQFLFNKKHGVANFQGANAVALNDCMGRWNGSPSHGAQPTVAGIWDGIYVGKSPDFPASSSALEPQMMIINGGDYSYNSRYGANFDKAYFCNLNGGYIELNKVADLRIGASFGCQINNPMLRVLTPVLEVVFSDPDIPSATLYNYPNRIVANGRNYGDGLAYSGFVGFDSRTRTSFKQQLGALYSAGSIGESIMYPGSDGSITCTSTSNLYFNIVDRLILRANRFRLGSNNDPLGVSSAESSFSPSGATEQSTFFAMIPTNGQAFRFYNAQGGGANTADTAIRVPKNSVTSRSINAGGTINADGADYAEYMYKADDCGEIQKGEIVGVNSDGKLTKIYDDAISFIVKSTNPSIVGGDNWFNESFDVIEPTYSFDGVLSDSAHDNEIEQFKRLESKYRDQLELDILEYRQRKTDFESRMETARQSVDRMAFCGQVPIIYNASVGDYIIPSRNSDGTIGIETTKAPTFEQHLKCVGKVWRVVDSTPHIVVFNN